ncbi:MAG: GNAT family N-acetyltransferase [Candidatus Helarchaeota archaeon]|nr:GNAT family N-acetyltransferase [Candidatus Helarchaeota archaeon]
MIKIRDYQKADYQATIRLMKQLVELYKITEFDEKNWEMTLRQRLFSPQQRTLIAEYEGKIAGMCFVDVKWNEIGFIIGNIKNIVVDENFRNRGISIKLLNEAIDILTAMAVDRIQINVNVEVQNVVPFFEKMGFKQEYIAMSRSVKKEKTNDKRK